MDVSGAKVSLASRLVYTTLPSMYPSGIFSYTPGARITFRRRTFQSRLPPVFCWGGNRKDVRKRDWEGYMQDGVECHRERRACALPSGSGHCSRREN